MILQTIRTKTSVDENNICPNLLLAEADFLAKGTNFSSIRSRFSWLGNIFMLPKQMGAQRPFQEKPCHCRQASSRLAEHEARADSHHSQECDRETHRQILDPGFSSETCRQTNMSCCMCELVETTHKRAFEHGLHTVKSVVFLRRWGDGLSNRCVLEQGCVTVRPRPFVKTSSSQDDTTNIPAPTFF